MIADLLLAIASRWALYSVLGVAFAFGFRVGGFFDLSIGGSFLIAGYTAWALDAAGAPIVLAVSGGIGTSGLLAVILGHRFIAPLTVRLPPLSLFVWTLGLLYLIEAALSIFTGEQAKMLRPSVSSFNFMGVMMSAVQGAFFLTAVAALASVVLLLRGTRWGRFARAVADDRVLASSYGFPVTRVLVMSHASAGALAGLAGVYFVAERALDPSQAMTVLLAAMVAAILGGDSVEGAALGAFLLAMLEVGLGFLLPAFWRSTIVFTVLLVVLAFKPGGVVAVVRRRF
jgi:branched-chain amino acid transport system permease protein